MSNKINKNSTMLRVVSEEGVLSYRLCIVDEEGDVVSVSYDMYSPRASSPKDLSLLLHYMQEAAKKPILIKHGGNRKIGGWTDVSPLLEEFEDILRGELS